MFVEGDGEGEGGLAFGALVDGVERLPAAAVGFAAVLEVPVLALVPDGCDCDLELPVGTGVLEIGAPNTASKPLLVGGAAELAALGDAFELVVRFADEEEPEATDCLFVPEDSFGFESFGGGGVRLDEADCCGRSRDGSRERSTSLLLRRASFSLLCFGIEYEGAVDALA